MMFPKLFNANLVNEGMIQTITFVPQWQSEEEQAMMTT